MYEVARDLPEFTGYLMLTELEPKLTLAQCMVIAPTANIICEKKYLLDAYNAGAQAICDMLLGKITTLYFKSRRVDNRFTIFCNREDVVNSYNHAGRYGTPGLWFLVGTMKSDVPNMRLEFQDHPRLPPAYEIVKSSPEAKLDESGLKYIGEIS